MFKSIDEVRALVRAFEETELPMSDWDHRARLAVAAWYLSGLVEAEAADRFIDGLRRYKYAQGIDATARQAYHETVTLFWLSLARSFLRQCPPAHSRLDRINDLLDRFATREDLIYDFYRRETLAGAEARRVWVEPDRRPLETIEAFCRAGLVE